MLCNQCGREIPDQVKFCRYCGAACAPFATDPEPIPEEPTKKRRWLLPVILAGIAVCIVVILILWFTAPDKQPDPPVEAPPVSDEPTDVPNIEPEEPDAQIPPVYEAYIDGESRITAGKTVKLTAGLSPEGEIVRIVWTSSDETIATVADGTVTGISEGDVILRVLIATEDNQVVEAEFPFTVDPIPVTYNAVLEPEEMTLRAGAADTFEVKVSAEPEQEEIDYTVTWESSDPLVAAVTDGRVQAVGEGTAGITARVSLPGGKLIVLQGSVSVTAAAPAAPPVTTNPTPAPKPTTPQNPPASQNPAAPQNPTTPQQPAPNPTLKDEALIATEDYLISNSDTAYISTASLQKLTDEELILARNEIYARHGRLFDTGWIQEYFNEQSWYKGTVAPAAFDPAVFNPYELENLLRIQQVERSR